MDMKPLDGDNAAPDVMAMIDTAGDDWWLQAVGDIDTAVIETMQTSGGGYQKLIAVRIPLRRNNSDEVKVWNVMLDLENAAQLIGMLAHSCKFLMAHNEIHGDGNE